MGSFGIWPPISTREGKTLHATDTTTRSVTQMDFAADQHNSAWAASRAA